MLISTYSDLLRLGVPVLFMLSAWTACSSPGPAAEADGQDPNEQVDRAGLEALYWSRLQASRTNFTQADVDFMTDMIIHHAQALIMSRLAPENDAGRPVQILAARIINAQDDEIRTMQRWLSDRGQPVPEIEIDGLTMTVRMTEGREPAGHHHEHNGTGHHDRDEDGNDRHEQRDHRHHHGHDSMDHDEVMAHHHDMPGMLSQDQIEELASLRGREFDRKFLEYMIEHHEGAVIMVRELFQKDGAAGNPETFDLASDIYAEQVTEINRMRTMLINMAQSPE
jgi:uncharacterized protein (DUF305 family)